ncbi:hypothetical protein OF850_14205 [Roseococcus sp. MDT2-1-1]|uniref:Uncharacterized protein n=1 Tax=Sabulicella glaciei TaxID=2984948 RepID=A0ABT3NX99_9PROT|nr:hypothetical protein [Roseococcus sp. MDT2-1-1]
MIALGFLMGALSIAIFHQGTLFLLFHHANAIPEATQVIGRVAAPGWDLSRMMPNPPFGLPVPLLLNQMFWGGVWGIVIAAVLHATPAPDLLTGFLVGAVGCTLVAVTVVAGLKGLPPFAGGNVQTLLRAALVNGAFGWGTALMLRPARLRSFRAAPLRPVRT